LAVRLPVQARKNMKNPYGGRTAGNVRLIQRPLGRPFFIPLGPYHWWRNMQCGMQTTAMFHDCGKAFLRPANTLLPKRCVSSVWPAFCQF